MSIKSSDDVCYEGLRVVYNKGNIKCHGESVFIFLQGRKNAFISINLAFQDRDKIIELIGTFSTISADSHKASMGTVVLRKDKSILFKNMEPKEYLKGSSYYNSQNEIIKKLQFHTIDPI